jgi:hypothetical protein
MLTIAKPFKMNCKVVLFSKHTTENRGEFFRVNWDCIIVEKTQHLKLISNVINNINYHEMFSIFLPFNCVCFFYKSQLYFSAKDNSTFFRKAAKLAKGD